MLEIIIITFCLSHLVVSIANNISIKTNLKKIIGCKSCVSFYISLIISCNLFTASVVWIIMYIYTHKVESWLTTTRI